MSLLPICLVLGTLLGLLLSGALTPSTTYVTSSNTTGSGSSVTVNVNSTSSSTSSVTSTGSNTTSILPIYIFTNGTFAVPLLSGFGLTGLTGITNIGLTGLTTGLLGIGQIGGILFGRSFETTYFSILQYLLDLVYTFVESFVVDGDYDDTDDGDYVYMEPDFAFP